MIYGVLEWICTVIALAAFLYRVLTLPRHDLDPARAALTVYFLGSFLSFAVGLDAISPHIAHLLGTRNITVILSHAAVILLTAAQQVVLIYWAYPPEQARPRAVRRMLAFGVVLVVLVVMFLMILPSRRHGTSETSSLLNMYNPYYAWYLVLFTTAAAVGQVITLRMSWAYGKIARGGWLRLGMYTVAAGAGLILVYCALRLAEVIGTQAGFDMAAWNPVQWLSGDFGSLLELLGWTAPGWGPPLSAASLWIADYRRYQRLRPLWSALHQASPDIALDAPHSSIADLVSVRDLNYRLYRRTIEILDGQRALRPYLDPTATDLATRLALRTGVTADQLGPTVDAIQLHMALRAKAAGSPALADPTATAVRLDDNLADVTERLTALAVAFRRCAGLADATPDARQTTPTT